MRKSVLYALNYLLQRNGEVTTGSNKKQNTVFPDKI